MEHGICFNSFEFRKVIRTNKNFQLYKLIRDNNLHDIKGEKKKKIKGSSQKSLKGLMLLDFNSLYGLVRVYRFSVKSFCWSKTRQNLHCMLPGSEILSQIF